MFAHKYQKFSNQIVNDANGDVASPNLQSSARPKHIINKQKLNTLVLNLNQPTFRQQSINGNAKLTRCAIKTSKPSDQYAKNTQSEHTISVTAADKLLLLSTIQRSLSSIHLHQSDIETNFRRLMMSKRPNKGVPIDESMADSERDMDYTIEMQQQQQQQQQPEQSTSACQCCYHDENHQYEYDSQQLPGKLLNFIVLMAIVVHYLTIAFIEPNYFD